MMVNPYLRYDGLFCKVVVRNSNGTTSSYKGVVSINGDSDINVEGDIKQATLNICVIDSITYLKI